MSIGDRIKELREQAGLSRKELAAKLGITPAAVSHYEQGLNSPKDTILIKIFEVLRCDANYLFQDDMKQSYRAFTTTIQEQDMLIKIRTLPDKEQRIIKSIIDAFYDVNEEMVHEKRKT